MTASTAQKKGPEGGNLPSRDPQSLQGNQNMDIVITDTPQVKVPRGPKAFNVDMDRLAAMSIRDLMDLQSAIKTTLDVAVALSNAPRFWSHDAEGVVDYTEAGLYLCDLMDVLGSLGTAIENTAQVRKTESSAEAEERAWLLIRAAADDADELRAVATIAADGLGDTLKLRAAEHRQMMAVREPRGRA